MKLKCSFVQLPKIYSFLTGNELKVFTVIFDEWSMMKNEDGWYYRSWKDLCSDCNIASATLKKCIDSLISKGLLQKKIHPKKEQMSNEYKINLEGVYSLASIPTSKNEVGYIKKQSTSNNHTTNNNNIGFNNIISTVSISPLDRVKPLNGDSVNSSKGDSVDKGVKQQNKMNEMSDKGAIGVKSTYGSTIVEDVKPLMECRPAPAPQRSTEDDMEFNKAVDKRKDFLFNGTKCLFDFEKGFKDLAIAKENVWKFKPWSDDAKKKWTDDFNKWWVNSKPFIYKSYLRTLDYMNETLKLNSMDRFEEMCSMIEE